MLASVYLTHNFPNEDVERCKIPYNSEITTIQKGEDGAGISPRVLLQQLVENAEEYYKEDLTLDLFREQCIDQQLCDIFLLDFEPSLGTYYFLCHFLNLLVIFLRTLWLHRNKVEVKFGRQTEVLVFVERSGELKRG